MSFLNQQASNSWPYDWRFAGISLASLLFLFVASDRQATAATTYQWERTIGGPTQDSGVGQFDSPYGIAIDSSGNIWVADTGNSRIEEFSSTAGYLRTLGSYGTGPGQFNGEMGLAFDNSRERRVTPENDRVTP